MSAAATTTPGLSSIALNWMLAHAAGCGLPLADTVVAENRERMKPGCDISEGPWYDVVKNRFRAVRWNDVVHESVRFDGRGRCNNPPLGIALVNDAGVVTGSFTA